MPNWCSCELTLNGPQNEMNKFNSENLDNDNDIDFNLGVPFPEDLDFDTHWYNWRLSQWGTKWSACDTIINRVWDKKDCNLLTEISYLINTAWSPPIPWVLKISEKYPEVRFKLKYEENNLNFSGIYIVKNGDILLDENGIHGEYYGEKYHSENDTEDTSEDEDTV